MGWFKRAFGFSSKPITKAAAYLNPNAYISHTGGASMAEGNSLKEASGDALSPYGQGMSQDEIAKMDADAKAALAQKEYEEQAAAGRAKVAAKRRRGFSSTILTGGAGTLGGSESGSATLG